MDGIGRTIFPLPSVMKPKETSSRYDQNERDFLFEMLKRDVFAAFYDACRTRKREVDMSRMDVAIRMGKDKTGISKLLSGPANWTLRTISDAANAIDTDVKIVFCDRKHAGRYFDRTGAHIHSVDTKPLSSSLMFLGVLVPNFIRSQSGDRRKLSNNTGSTVTIDAVPGIDYAPVTNKFNSR